MGTQGRLVGREPELTALAELVEDAVAGRGRVVLLTGEAGIGKTSLAEAVATMARELRFDTAWGRCSSAEMPAYWPWRQVLNSLLGNADLLEPGRFTSRPELYAAVATGTAPVDVPRLACSREPGRLARVTGLATVSRILGLDVIHAG